MPANASDIRKTAAMELATARWISGVGLGAAERWAVGARFGAVGRDMRVLRWNVIIADLASGYSQGCSEFPAF
jgi:hypothetical protein